MSMQHTIQSKISAGLKITCLEVENESHMHNVPPGSESHFKVVVVSDDFEGLSRVKRHQTIYRLLAAEMSGAIHALAIHTFTSSEWIERQAAASASPPCMGGSKADH